MTRLDQILCLKLIILIKVHTKKYTDRLTEIPIKSRLGVDHTLGYFVLILI